VNVNVNVNELSGAGLKFRSESGEKETLLLAAFDDESEAGDRLIMVPDVPMGGAIHITFNGGEAAASNVHQVSIDGTHTCCCYGTLILTPYACVRAPPFVA
jgi:hypothetical protein